MRGVEGPLSPAFQALSSRAFEGPVWCSYRCSYHVLSCSYTSLYYAHTSRGAPRGSRHIYWKEGNMWPEPAFHQMLDAHINHVPQWCRELWLCCNLAVPPRLIALYRTHSLYRLLRSQLDVVLSLSHKHVLSLSHTHNHTHTRSHTCVWEWGCVMVVV